VMSSSEFTRKLIEAIAEDKGITTMELMEYPPQEQSAFKEFFEATRENREAIEEHKRVVAGCVYQEYIKELVENGKLGVE
jgi:ABC-type Zn uptake system ZnuABC Zn-binding protein ZnuA